ncbi:MAG: hypothetical protein SGJ13_00820 [Actinomycetota bacterium]|nr:hypothetical protein [Actinomycetota bacterium]
MATLATLAIGVASITPASALPSTSASVANNVLTITGTPQSDAVALRLAPGAVKNRRNWRT